MAEDLGGMNQEPSSEGSAQPGKPQSEVSAKAREESLEAVHELGDKVAQAEQAEGKPVPSQAQADETAGSGI